MEYDIIEASDTHTLKLRVTRKLQQGWEPIGGAVKGTNWYYQTIIRKDRNNEMPSM